MTKVVDWFQDNRQRKMDFAYHPGSIGVAAPLIYRWTVEDADGAILYCYVGKAKRGAHRPRMHYSRNMANCCAGRPYRRGAPNGFRKVHRQLADAVLHGHRITLTLLCNVTPGEDINAVEQAMQRRYNCPPS